MNIDELVASVKDLEPKNNSLVYIGISGFGGSGKSTLAEILKARTDGLEVISIDDFIIGPQDQRSTDWHTFDRERLKEEILEVARPKQVLTYMQYQSGVYANGLPGTTRTIEPKKYLLIEGCGILHPTLMKYYDLSVWVSCSLQTATKRAKKRDKSQGNDHDKLWDEVWGPNDKDYYNKFRPDNLASIIFGETS